ncbi:DUF262 domain-containing protein [Chryseobacterium sp. SC28]|uniref:DUF262 domain-containing protein n=1 Tax=Chryseobacterium sp. SC28 TaxID=2268028 RepID=UPI000F645C7B|nr:DUF262 domain-containing protein [Chryseobacterium sp. SC28]RRQ45688.1 DUF262 domain-containing protein [Chryseobacterium sp. SC28]
MKFDSVEKLLSYGIFTIPEYQRGYSWTEDQLDDLLNDLADVEFIKEHYAGTITLIKSGQEKIGITDLTKYDIVDGQQRLTTFHLLLVSIYHRIREINASEADEVIIKNVLSKGKSLLRLNNKDNQEFFFSLLNEQDINDIKKFTPKSKTQKNLINSRIHFYTYLQRYTSIITLIKIYNNLLSKFKVNVFELEEESEVGLIFETMNDRGLPLSDMDKVKNYLIYLTHRLNEKTLAKEINKKFGEIFTELMEIKNYSITRIENQFLKHCYIVYSGDNKDLSDVPKKIKTQLIKQREIFVKKNLFDNDTAQREKKIKEIKDFNNFLHKSANYYSAILNQSFDNEGVNNSFFRLETLGKIETFLPLYLAILNNKKFKPEFLIAINEILEVFTIRVFVFGNKKGNTGNSALFELAYKVFTNQINFTELKKELRNLIEKNSNNSDLKKSIVNIGAYNSVNHYSLKLILLDYEYFLQGESVTKFDIGAIKDLIHNSKISIEHIAPQTILPGVKPMENINLLGNLVLTFNNAGLANRTFISKKNTYAKSNFASERELVEYDDWNDKTILERGKKIQKFIMEKWKP